MVSKNFKIIYSLISISCIAGMHAGSSHQYVIERIKQEAVDQKKTLIKNQEAKSTFARKVTQAGIFALSVIGGVGIAYALFRNKSQGASAETEHIVEGATKVTKQQLQQELKKLSEHIDSGPQICSWAWWKSCLINIVLTPAILVKLFKGIGSLSGLLSKKIFFADSPETYIEQATQLGVLAVRTNDQGILEKNLVKGAISKELEHSAIMLDKMNSTADNGIEFHKKSIVYSFNRVIADMTGLCAFIYHMADKWSSTAALSAEAADRAQYLQHITNRAGESLENMLNGVGNKQPTISIIKDFFNELEQVLISFARIEREYALAIQKS